MRGTSMGSNRKLPEIVAQTKAVNVESKLKQINKKDLSFSFK